MNMLCWHLNEAKWKVSKKKLWLLLLSFLVLELTNLKVLEIKWLNEVIVLFDNIRFQKKMKVDLDILHVWLEFCVWLKLIIIQIVES